MAVWDVLLMCHTKWLFQGGGIVAIFPFCPYLYFGAIKDLQYISFFRSHRPITRAHIKVHCDQNILGRSLLFGVFGHVVSGFPPLGIGIGDAKTDDSTCYYCVIYFQLKSRFARGEIIRDAARSFGGVCRYIAIWSFKGSAALSVRGIGVLLVCTVNTILLAIEG